MQGWCNSAFLSARMMYVVFHTGTFHWSGLEPKKKMIWKYPKDLQSMVEEFIFYSVSCSSTSMLVSGAGYWLMLTCIGKTSPGSVRGKSVNVLPPSISVLRRGIEIDPSWPWQPGCKRESPKKALYQLEVPPNHHPLNQRVVLFTFTWEDYCRVPSKRNSS